MQDPVENVLNRRVRDLQVHYGNNIILEVEDEIHCAHKLCNEIFTEEKNKEEFGDCYRMHGHSYKIVFSMRGGIDVQTGYVINFKDLKPAWRQFDHQNLNEMEAFKGLSTTVEVFCMIVADEIQKIFKSKDVNWAQFTVKAFETSKASATLVVYNENIL